MTVRRVLRFVDDLDGSAAAETVWFGLDGVGYEVDLSAAHAAALRGLLDRYVTAGRRIGRVEAGAVGRVRRALARAHQAIGTATEAATPTATSPGQQRTPPALAPPAAASPAPAASAEPVKVRFSDQHIPTRR